MKENHSDFILFKTEDEKISVDVRFEDETVWLTQDQMAALFERDRTVIVKHIANIFSEGELDKKSNVQFLHIANSDKPVKFYNLNVIISVGYRVKSQRGTQFRIWSTKRLNEYKKYQQKTLSEAEKNYLESLNVLENKTKK